jgi:hypothetical protein
MSRFELSHRRDTVRTHHQVDRTGRKRVAQSAGTKDNLEDRLILDEHRYNHFPAGAEIRDRRRNASTSVSEWPRRGGDHVEDGEFVSGAEDAPRHSLSHATQADKSNLHGGPLKGKSSKFKSWEVSGK